MTKRKIFLLASCAALLCVLVAQTILAGRGSSKVFALGDKIQIDSLEIQNAGDVVSIEKQGDGWVVGPRRYSANQGTVDSMVESISSVTALDVVGKAGGERADERYGFGEGSRVTVTASAGGKIARTLVVGKTSSTGSQTYVTMDGGKDVLLASGNLRSVFAKSENDARSKIVYKLDQDKMSAVSLDTGGKRLSFKKNDDGAWELEGESCDSEKISSWATSLYSVSVSSWLDDSFALPGSPVSVALMTAGDASATLNVYKAGDGDDVKYYGSSSALPYKFELSSYAAGKYIKSADDFKK